MMKISLLVAAAMCSAMCFAQSPSLSLANAKPASALRDMAQSGSERSLNFKSQLAYMHANAHFAAAPQRADDTTLPTQLISEQPEGTLYHNMYRTASGFMTYYILTYYLTQDGLTADVVKADDGSVYIKSPISQFSTDSWIKGTMGQGDTINVQLPQLIYQEDYYGTKYNYYAWRMVYDSGNFVKDSVSQTMQYVMKGDSIILVGDHDYDDYGKVIMGVGSESGSWYGYGDYAVCMSQVKQQPSRPVNTDNMFKAVLTYDKKNTNWADDMSQDAFLDGKPILVSVVMDNDDVFLGGLYTPNPDVWVKGKKDGSKVTFTNESYMGVDEDRGYHLFFMPTTSAWQYFSNYNQYSVYSYLTGQDLTFDFDADTYAMSSDGEMNVNVGRATVYSGGFFAHPRLALYEEVPGKPKQPTILASSSSEYDPSYGYGNIVFTYDPYDENGAFMNPEKLFYNLYLDDEEEPFVFATDEYKEMTEDMTDVPIGYDDNCDIYTYTDGRHSVYTYFQGVDKVGVQLVNRSGDEERRSDIAWLNFAELAGISAPQHTDADVLSVSYTDLSGRLVSAPSKGVFVKTMRMADGSVRCVKVVK